MNPTVLFLVLAWMLLMLLIISARWASVAVIRTYFREKRAHLRAMLNSENLKDIKEE